MLPLPVQHAHFIKYHCATAAAAAAAVAAAATANDDDDTAAAAAAATAAAPTLLGCRTTCRYLSLELGAPILTDASNFFPAANVNDQSCRYEVFGCTISKALNYDSTATVSSGCVEPIAGCRDTFAYNYASDATIDHAEVIASWAGERSSLEEALEEFAYLGEHEHVAQIMRLKEDVTCMYTTYGCMSPAAANYDYKAT